MKKLLFLISFVYFFLSLNAKIFAQNPILDSLQNLLKKERNDTKRKADILGQLAFHTWEDDMQKTEQYAQACIKLSDKLQYRQAKGYALYSLGVVMGLQAKKQLAQKYFDEAQQIAQKAKNKELEAYIQYGRYYFTIDEHGLKYGSQFVFYKNVYLKAIQLFEESNCYDGLVLSFVEIAMVFVSNNDKKKAFEYINKALKLKNKVKNRKVLISLYISLSELNQNLGNQRKSVEYYLKAKTLVEQYPSTFSKIELKMASINFEDNLTKKREILKEVLRLAEDYNWIEGRIIALNVIGDIYGHQQDTVALRYFEEATKLSQKYQINKILCLAFIAGYYENVTKDYAKASYYTKLILEQPDSLSTYYISTRYRLLAYYATKLKQYEQAESYLKQIPQEGFKEFFVINFYYEIYSDIEAGRGNYAKALDYHKQSAAIRDSINQQSKVQTLEIFNQENELMENNYQLEVLKKEREAEHQKALNRQNLLFASLGGVLLLLLLAYILWRNNRIKQKANKLLSEQKEEIQTALDLVQQERQKSDKLLLNILPEETAQELKEKGSATPQHYELVSVLFTDFKGFTQAVENLKPIEVIQELDFCFNKFDEIVEKYGLERIKTIGDAYMAVGGLPLANETNPIDAVRAGLEIQQFMNDLKIQREAEGKTAWQCRLGIHSGEVIAGVVGTKKFAYDIWGDTVNLASRMESSGEVGKVNISGATYELVKHIFQCAYRGKIEAKNKGEVEMYFVEKVSINSITD